LCNKIIYVMNKRYLLLPFMFFMCLSVALFAQPGNANCGTCDVNPDCPTLMPDGGLCPELIPDGQVGVPYSFPVTFYMPETVSVTEPIETDITLIDVQITDMVNLPSGLEWSCNNADCSYQPSSNPPGSELGCITICGTPNAAPGEYTINIRLLADVSVAALGGAVLEDQEQFFTATITILPPDVPIEFNILAGCESLTDTVTAIQDFNPDQPTTWSWALDGGATADTKGVRYEYTEPGMYDIILETTVYDYVVTELCVNSISDGYCGDVEEPVCNCGTPIIGVCPDPYVSILGTNLPTASGTTSNCWNNLSLPTGGLDFALTVFDEDNGPPVGSDNDMLGEFMINVNNGEGSYDFSNGNLSGTITIGTILNAVTTDTLTVTVYDNPPAPEFAQDSDDLTVSNDNGYDIQWYLDGVAIDGATDATYTIIGSGDYSATYIDANGCMSTSDEVTAIFSSIENTISEANVSALYPNPTNKAVYLSMEFLSTQDVELNIIDALGRTVFQENHNTQSGEQIYQIDLSKLDSGLYFVQVRLGDGSRMTQRLMVL
jgi:hypothetical protein